MASFDERVYGTKILGDRLTKRGKPRLHVNDTFALNENEIGDLIGIQIAVSKEELAYEQGNDNLRNHNRYVDSNQHKPLEELKFGGRVEYTELHSLADLMIFLTEEVYRLTTMKALDTGDLRDSQTWKRDGSTVTNHNVPILNKGEQLVLYANIRYAKYQEFGYRKVVGKYIYRQAARKAKARFGKDFIIEHILIQDKDIPPQKVKRVRALKGGGVKFFTGYSADYYRERWKASYPAIKIVQRSGIQYHV